MTIAAVHRGGIGTFLASASATSQSSSNILSTADGGAISTPQAKTGDYIIVFIQYQSSAGPGAITCSMNGLCVFTQLGTTESMGGTRYAAVFGGVYLGVAASNVDTITATAPATITFFSLTHLWFRGVDTTTPIDVATTQTTTASGTSHASPSITPTTNGALVLALFTANNDDGAGGTIYPAAPSGWTKESNFGTLTGTDGSQAVYSKVVNPAAATTTTITSTATVISGVFSIALRPRTSDPVDEIFVGRTTTRTVTSTTGGWTKSPPALAPAQFRLAPLATDIVVVVAYFVDAGGVSETYDSAVWTRHLDAGAGSGWWLFTALYDAALVLPSFTAPGTTDLFSAFAIVLRDVNPNAPFDVSADVGETNTTVNWPAVTPTNNDAIIARFGTGFDDVPFCTSIANGDSIIPFLPAWATTTGTTDSGAFISLQSLSGGAGVSTGTSAVVMNVSAGVRMLTVAFNRAPDLKQIVSGVDSGSVLVDSTLSLGTAGVFVVSDVQLGALVVNTALVETRQRVVAPRRAMIWHRGINGNQTGVVT